MPLALVCRTRQLRQDRTPLRAVPRGGGRGRRSAARRPQPGRRRGARARASARPGRPSRRLGHHVRRPVRGGAGPLPRASPGRERRAATAPHGAGRRRGAALGARAVGPVPGVRRRAARPGRRAGRGPAAGASGRRRSPRRDPRPRRAPPCRPRCARPDRPARDAGAGRRAARVAARGVERSAGAGPRLRGHDGRAGSRPARDRGAVAGDGVTAVRAGQAGLRRRARLSRRSCRRVLRSRSFLRPSTSTIPLSRTSSARSLPTRPRRRRPTRPAR